uniref:Heme-binding protein soul2 n=1 Tax=Amphilophus citrinellus TaxID=61819 RepID=A0A3Q0RMP4_AMPCI
MKGKCMLIFTIFLVSFCNGQDFCPKEKCPHLCLCCVQDFEARLYGATNWITTKLDSTGARDYLAANSRKLISAACIHNLILSVTTQSSEIPDDCWPVLVTVTKGEGEPKMSVSWFVPPDGKKSEMSDPLVKLESKPEVTVYVRVFSGAPSTETGQENTKLLREALAKAGKRFDPNTHAAATYDSYFSLTHHNEIWIYPA